MRMYFGDEVEENDRDPNLKLIEQEVRRSTLIAYRVDGGDLPVCRFEPRLLGKGQTVFVDV